jgi:hypothetical protein
MLHNHLFPHNMQEFYSYEVIYFTSNNIHVEHEGEAKQPRLLKVNELLNLWCM